MPGPIIEPENCESVLGEVDPSLCRPKIRSGQVQRIFITLLDGNESFGAYDSTNPLDATAVNNPSAWSDRMDQTGTIPGAIITLHVMGEKALPEDEEQELPLGMTRVLARNHTLSASLPETSDKINMLMRQWAKYGATVGAWYETSQPTLLGSADGIHIPIRMSIKAGQVVPRERSGIHGWEITGTWKELGSEDMIDSPVPATPEPGSGTGSGSGV